MVDSFERSCNPDKKRWELQRKCIQSFQKDFLYASSVEIINRIQSFKEIPPGAGFGPKSISVHLRTIGYSYIFLQIVILYKGTVYGGFLASHFSGMPWNDIDIMFDTCDLIKAFKDNLCRWIMFTTGVPLVDIYFTLETKSKYGHKHLLKIGDITIKVDITSRSGLSQCIRNKSHSNFGQHPVTVGRMLSFNSRGLFLKSALTQTNITNYYVFEVINLLKEGKDIFFVTDKLRDEIRRCNEHPSPENEKFTIVYKNYYFERLVNISDKDGYELLPNDWRDTVASWHKKRITTGQSSSA